VIMGTTGKYTDPGMTIPPSPDRPQGAGYSALLLMQATDNGDVS
jgi:hypothetical protein